LLAGVDGAARALTAPMLSYVDVTFRSMPKDASVEAAVHRWVARLEALRIAVQRAEVTIEASGRRRTVITLTLRLTDGSMWTAATAHADRYVGVADVFRAMKQQVQPPAPQRTHRLAFA
jgi:hypothetical protein